MEKLVGFNLCAGKVRDAANFTASTWRKLERVRIGEKQMKPSRQAGIQPFFLSRSSTSEKEGATNSSNGESTSSTLPAPAAAAAEGSQLIDLSMDDVPSPAAVAAEKSQLIDLSMDDVSSVSPRKVDSESTSPKPSPKPYKRNNNAYWIVSECRRVGRGTTEVKELLHIVLSTLNELKQLDTVRESVDVSILYMNAFSDDKSNLFKGNKRDMQFINAMAEKSDDLVGDESLTPRLLDATLFHEFVLV